MYHRSLTRVTKNRPSFRWCTEWFRCPFRIKTLARRNGIHLDVEKLARKKLVRKLLGNLNSFQEYPASKDVKRCRLPYLGKFSTNLAKILRGYNFFPGFYNSTNVSDMLCSPRDPVPLLEKSGVYKLTCPDCQMVYIGETERRFSIRFEEHRVAFESRLQKRQSAFAEHLLEIRHNFDLERCTPLHIENRFRRRKVLEDYEIFQHTVVCGEEGILNRYVNDQGLIATYFGKNQLVSGSVDRGVAVLPVQVDLSPPPPNKDYVPDLEDSLCCSNSSPLSLEKLNEVGRGRGFRTIKIKGDGNLLVMIVKNPSSTLMKSNDVSTWPTTRTLQNSLVLAERWQDNVSVLLNSTFDEML